ncbi:MAG: hypothetical protein II956_16045 [Bacteroidales bacterium]|nr:hypothetical protein [Bacteroidales bacterium]
MASLGKILGITAAVGFVGYGIYWGVSRAADVSSLAKNVSFNISVSKVKFSNKVLGIPTTVTIYLTVEIINPTKLSISFEKPTVWAYYDGKTLAQSIQSTDKIKLEPQGSTFIKNIALKIPMASNISLFMDMGKRVFSNLNTQDKIVSQIITNAKDLLPLISVQIKTYIGQTPIEYTTSLAAEETMTTTEE